MLSKYEVKVQVDMNIQQDAVHKTRQTILTWILLVGPGIAEFFFRWQNFKLNSKFSSKGAPKFSSKEKRNTFANGSPFPLFFQKAKKNHIIRFSRR